MTVKRTFYFDPYAEGSAVFLGPTETKLMELAWKKRNVTVKTALYHLGEKNRLAYTTIMTVLGRLADKGLLHKKKEGRGFVYTPALHKNEFLEQRLKIVANCLKRNFKNLP